MAVNPDLAGRVFDPVGPYEVGREKIREFERAVLAEGSREGAGIAPATFPIVLQDLALQALLAAPDTGIALERTVHAEQRFAYERGIVAGDLLTAQLSVDAVRTVGANALVTSSTVIRDAEGQTVITATSVLLVGAES